MSDDWNTVTVIGNRTGGNKGGMSKERQVNLARRQGAGGSTEQKYGGGGNKQGSTGLNTAKLDAETEELRHKTVDKSVGQLIAQGESEQRESPVNSQVVESQWFQVVRPRRCRRRSWRPRSRRSHRS